MPPRVFVIPLVMQLSTQPADSQPVRTYLTFWERDAVAKESPKFAPTIRTMKATCQQGEFEVKLLPSKYTALQGRAWICDDETPAWAEKCDAQAAQQVAFIAGDNHIPAVR
jgi:hypothetical protein